MTEWTSDELRRIGAANELEITALRDDGTLSRPVPIWVVRVGDQLYVRSWRGENGGWFRTAHKSRAGHVSAGGVESDVALFDAGDEVNDAVDNAYRNKYSRYSSYVPPMLSPQARATTLELVPDREDGA